MPVLLGAAWLSEQNVGVAYFLDITDRKRQEEAIRRQTRILRSILDSIGDGVVVADEDGNFVLFNPAAEQILRLGMTDTRPENWSERYSIYQQDGETLFPVGKLPLVRAALHGEKIDQVEMYINHDRIPEGLWISVTGRPMYDEKQNLKGGVAVFRDITGHKQVEQRLAQDALMLANVRDAIIFTDTEGIVTYWNEGATRLFGLNPAEILGRPYSDRYSEPERSAVIEMMRTITAQGEWSGEWQDRRKDGAEIWIELRATCIRDLQGRFSGIMGVSHDITARKKAEIERDRALRRLQVQIDRMPLGYLLLDDEFSPLDWNSTAERIFGFSTVEVLRMRPPFLEIVPPEAWPKVRELFTRIRAGDMSANATVENLTKDGRTITCEWHNTPLYDDNGDFQGALALFQDITLRKESEEALRMRDRAIQAVGQGILISDARLPDHPTIYVSQGFEQLTGYTQPEAIGKNCRFLQGKDTDPCAIARIRDALRDRRPCTVELLNYRKNGTPFWNELSISPVTNGDGQLTHFVGVQTDVTERRTLEEQFRQSQKMEAVGQLAGGVAHDFNNMLAVILGYCENLSESTNFDDRERDALDEIRDAARRAAALTRKLLAFSRKEVLEPMVLNLNNIVMEMDKMLRRLIGEDVELRADMSSTLWRVKVDPGQMEQVVMNLSVNARDAMPDGGTLTLETRNVELPEGDAQAPPDLKPGRYVRLSASDTGHGMDARVKSRVFEPFFTTKEPGKGTGLGLASVYGIIKQSDGRIAVVSEPGQGAKFTIYLPSSGEDEIENVEEQPPPVTTRGGETLLLVEDEDNVRKMLGLMLRAKGYRVIEAENGAEAIDLFEQAEHAIQLVVTDVVMPRISGRKLVENLRTVQPDIHVLYMSGYTDDAIVRQGILEPNFHFLQKPFLPAQLAAKVREVLDSRNGSDH